MCDGRCDGVGVSLVEISKLFLDDRHFFSMGQDHLIVYRSIDQMPRSPYFTLIPLLEYMFLIKLKSTVTH